VKVFATYEDILGYKGYLFPLVMANPAKFMGDNGRTKPATFRNGLLENCGIDFAKDGRGKQENPQVEAKGPRAATDQPNWNRDQQDSEEDERSDFARGFEFEQDDECGSFGQKTLSARITARGGI
jgi:hypothetical protein